MFYSKMSSYYRKRQQSPLMELVCVADMRLLRNAGENPRHLHRICFEEFRY